jgi:hypothetical protein
MLGLFFVLLFLFACRLCNQHRDLRDAGDESKHRRNRHDDDLHVQRPRLLQTVTERMRPSKT